MSTEAHKFEVVRAHDNYTVARFNTYRFAELCAKEWGSYPGTPNYYVRAGGAA